MSALLIGVIKKANKQLDNRWGCSVGHAFRNFNPPSHCNAHPRPAVQVLER